MSETEFEWPWQYNFPPFFTLQPHIETKAKQITAWKSLILDYFKAQRLCTLDVREVKDMPLFNNASINRTIELSALTAVLEELEKTGYAAPLDKQKKRWEIYWHTLEEFGTLIYSYVCRNNYVNTVMTLFELLEAGEDQSEAFYKLNVEVCIKVLRILEGDGKCELMLFDDSQGVKFF